MTNPFEELGLHPDVVRRLDDKRLKQFVFQQISMGLARYHPDNVAGIERDENGRLTEFVRSHHRQHRRLSVIRKELDNPEEFTRCKNEFLEMHSERDFDVELTRQSQGLYARADWLLKQIFAFVRPDKDAAFHLRSKSFEMMDMHGEPYTLHIGKTGVLVKEYGEETLRLPFHRLIGTMEDREGINRLLQPSESPRLMADGKPYSRMHGYGFGWYSFEKVIESVSPEIRPGAALVALHFREPKYFSLEGVVHEEIAKRIELGGGEEDVKNAQRIVAYFVAGKRELRNYSDEDVGAFAEMLKTKNGVLSKQKAGRLRNQLLGELKSGRAREAYERAFELLVGYVSRVESESAEYQGLSANG